MPTFLALVGMFISVMLIGIILLQRGRGGGLVGALSGLGGQSAFGTKAGDTFTRITIGIAAAWVLLAGIHGQVLRARTEKFKNETKEIAPLSKSKEPAVSSTKPEESEGGLTPDSKASESKGESKKEELKPEEPAKDDKSESPKSDDGTKKTGDNKKADSESGSTDAPKKNEAKPTENQSTEKGDEKK